MKDEMETFPSWGQRVRVQLALEGSPVQAVTH